MRRESFCLELRAILFFFEESLEQRLGLLALVAQDCSRGLIQHCTRVLEECTRAVCKNVDILLFSCNACNLFKVRPKILIRLARDLASKDSAGELCFILAMMFSNRDACKFFGRHPRCSFSCTNKEKKELDALRYFVSNKDFELVWRACPSLMPKIVAYEGFLSPDSAPHMYMSSIKPAVDEFLQKCEPFSNSKKEGYV